MDKKARIALWFLACVLLISIILLMLPMIKIVFAIPIFNTTYGGGITIYQVKEDISYTYNISINLTDASAGLNITTVNITLPSGFTFTSGTNGTANVTAGGPTVIIFTSAGSVLSWRNETLGIIINNTYGTRFFWFNATAATPGYYNFSVIAYNITGWAQSNISITVNDTTSPQVTIASPASSQGYAGTINFTTTTDENSTCRYSVNSGLNNYTMTKDAAGTSHNATNASASLTEGSITVNYYCNDTRTGLVGVGNNNLTMNVTFYKDTTAPNVTQIAPAEYTSTTTTSFNFTFNTSDLTSVTNCLLYIGSNSPTTLYDNLTSVTREQSMGIYNSSIAIGNYKWNITCVDSAGNLGSSALRNLTISAAAAAASSSTGGTTTTTWTKTETPTATQTDAGYTTDLGANERARVLVSGATHHVGVTAVSASAVTISVSSTTQTATLSIGGEKKFEITNDTFYDISVKLNSINSSKADLTIKTIHEEITGATTTPSGEEATTGEEGAGEGIAEEAAKLPVWAWILIIAAIIVVIVIIFVVVKKK